MKNIICKKFDFVYKNTLFSVDVKYNNASFGSNELSFWEYKVYSINNNKLIKPLYYKQKQKTGWILQNKEYRELSYTFCIKKCSNHKLINIFPLIKEQIIYEYFNQDIIKKYKTQIEKFTISIEKKYNKKMLLLKSEIKKLKTSLKNGQINQKIFQKKSSLFYKQIRLIKFKVDEVIRWYENRYFECCKLKKEYIVDFF